MPAHKKTTDKRLLGTWRSVTLGALLGTWFLVFGFWGHHSIGWLLFPVVNLVSLIASVIILIVSSKRGQVNRRTPSATTHAMTKPSIENSFVCPKCGKRTGGFARCQTPGCGELRREFRGRERVVVGEVGPCVLSGARTDVRLPNGDYLWASYFLEFLEAGWLDESYSYTDAYYATHPHRRRDDVA